MFRRSLAADIYLPVLDQCPRLGLPRCRAHVAPGPPLRKCLRLRHGRCYLRHFLVRGMGVSRFIRCPRQVHRQDPQQGQ